ncbi:hypothetical protein BsWGS_08745 [Bradybaena similaris]
MEPDKAKECCIWPRKCESDTKNERVHCHDEAVNFPLLTDLGFFSVEQHHESSRWPPDSIPSQCSDLVVRTNDASSHYSVLETLNVSNCTLVSGSYPNTQDSSLNADYQLLSMGWEKMHTCALLFPKPLLVHCMLVHYMDVGAL